MGRYRHSGDPAWESADGDPEGYGDPPTARQRNEARAARLAAARAERERKAADEQMHATLGDALTAALMRYLAGAAPASADNVKRALALVGYSDELKKLIVRCIEANPAMEESFLLIAELAYRDGEDAIKEDWNREEYR